MPHAGTPLVRIALAAYAVCNCLPLRAQVQGSDSLKVCNLGQVDVDVIVAKQGQAGVTKVAPKVCMTVYHEPNGVPANVGLAFTDSRGQWGPTRRTDLLPDFAGGISNASLTLY